MRKTIILSIILIFTTMGMVHAGMGPGRGGVKLPPGKWWRMPKIAQNQNITPEEQAALDKLYAQNRLQMIDLKAALEKEMVNFELIFDQTDFNESASLNQYKKVQAARTKLALERFKFVVEVRKLLGLERFKQLEGKYRELRKQRRNFRKQHGETRRPGRRFGQDGQEGGPSFE